MVKWRYEVKRWQGMLIQAFLWAGAIFSIWTPVIPKEYRTYIECGLATIAVLVNKKSSESNPDGTDARSSYEPDIKTFD